jgi:NAD(P)-dependent dehydrogenase (short-subunit alcohol dehydrogenase family)
MPVIARQGGAVVLMSRIAGLRVNTMLGTYAISKEAEMALARNLALEWGLSDIRVNAIAPALIKTDFARALWQDPEAGRAKAQSIRCAALAPSRTSTAWFSCWHRQREPISMARSSSSVAAQ